ncbi:MAG TPA: hypothetical protein VIM99_06235, partial [Blastocatellia bacterium]
GRPGDCLRKEKRACGISAGFPRMKIKGIFAVDPEKSRPDVIRLDLGDELCLKNSKPLKGHTRN